MAACELHRRPRHFLTDPNTPSPPFFKTKKVARYLRNKGFVSAFEAYNRPRNPQKVERWISHFSHRKEYVGVDFIWHLQVK